MTWVLFRDNGRNNWLLVCMSRPHSRSETSRTKYLPQTNFLFISWNDNKWDCQQQHLASKNIKFCWNLQFEVNWHENQHLMQIIVVDVPRSKFFTGDSSSALLYYRKDLRSINTYAKHAKLRSLNREQHLVSQRRNSLLKWAHYKNKRNTRQ